MKYEPEYIGVPNTKRDESNGQSPELPTLRDQFAMSALTGLLATPYKDKITTFVRLSYEIADAMMEARK